jgi:uncharacterized protein YbjT (DUF2867 family)
MKIMLAGATGLIGGMVLDQLLTSPAAPDVIVLTRRTTGKAHPKLTEHIAPMADWPTIVATLGVDTVICTLGTTIKAAGSKAAFEAVDLNCVVAIAQAARSAGARHFLVVSSVGADAASRTFYLGTKGRMESAVSALGYDRVDCFRPGLLRGPRVEKRLGERLGQAVQSVLDPLLLGGLKKYHSIQAQDVATAIVRHCVDSGKPGNSVHHYDDLTHIQP